MKILHLADLHIGKTLNNFSIYQEQEFALQQVLNYLKNNSIDYVVIAGDIYDRSIPSKEAIQVMNDFLSQLILDFKIPTIMIAGNHDGGERLSFLSSLLATNNLYIIGETYEIQPLEFKNVVFYPCAYNDYLSIKNHFKDKNILDSETALTRQLQDLPLSKDKYNIFIGHNYFVADSKIEELGGTNTISADLIKHFDYVALGHLHQAHYVKYPHIRYSGSIYKYSESEIKHQKSFTVITFDNQLHYETIPFEFNNDVLIIEDDYYNLIQKPLNTNYVYLHLTNKILIPNAYHELSKVFPNVITIKYLNYEYKEITTHKNIDEMNFEELFSDYFYQTTGHHLTKEQQVIMDTIFKEMEVYNENN